MFKYKREINNYEQARQIEYTISDNAKTCFCTTGSLYTKRPYHGMYIRNGKVLVENIVETFSTKSNEYKVVEIDTNSKELDTREYITQIDLEKNYFEYSFGELSYSKRYAFDEKNGTLCIEYTVKNSLKDNVEFKVIPLLTYRDFYNMKNNTMLKFNQRETNNGAFLALSVLNQENIVLKSDKMKWKASDKVFRDVKHELIDSDTKKKVYYEDLMICGEFSTKIKAEGETKIYVYISYKEFNIEDINTLNVFNNIEARNKNITFDIDENFVELQDLAKSILNTDMENMLVPYLPYKKDYNEEYINNIKNLSNIELEKDIEDLIATTQSIEGQYLYLKKVKEAKIVVTRVYEIIKEIGKLNLDENLKEKYNRLRLWYIEAVNRILQKEGRIELYIDSIKEILYDLIEPDNRATCFNSIEVAALMLNAVKIYLNILTWIGDTDKQIELQEIYFKNLIENEFWVSDKNIMKNNLKDEDTYASVEMLYTLSLSFPCVSNQIPNKILDTVFKELYTPYGLRKVSKFSPKYDSMIYPKYMAHFIKANLRLTGVTRASQKIAYNLVKELLQDVGKYVNGGTKAIYSEKGIPIDTKAYDTLTNAEMIRLYNMFI